jgi:predicted enzyme related to lactoylglutathione lyase
MTEPAFRHGTICYIIMPSNDPQVSSQFYADVFGWSIRSHDDGTLAFDDSVGQVSGMWVTDRQAVENPGAEVHIMVDNAAEAERKIERHGGTLVWRSGPEEREVYGTFRDPSGNLFGYFQHGTPEAD